MFPSWNVTKLNVFYTRIFENSEYIINLEGNHNLLKEKYPEVTKSIYLAQIID